MPFVQAKCPECGGMLAVDSSKKAAVCQFCGEAFIVQEAINNYNTYNTYNTTHQYGDGAVVNVYEDQNKDFVIEAGVLKEYHGEDDCVVVPQNVKTIREHCFENMPIKDIVLHNGIHKIGEYAFKGCSDLTNVTIQDGLTSIGKGAFYGCTGLQSIELPDSITSIDDSAFYGCTGLQSIELPNNITSIGQWAFNGCTNLQSIDLPDSITSIDYGAFDGCTSLQSVKLPESITSIGPYAFRLVNNIIYSGSLSGSLGDAKCINGYIEDGLVYKDNSKELLLGCLPSRTGSVSIPNSVTGIGDSAFYGCTGLQSIDLPDSITSIGEAAFVRCSSLTSVTIPEGVTGISNNAFCACTGLQSIELPESVTSIGDWAFAHCSSLTGITIPKNVTSIGAFAFRYCSRLTSVTVPEGVTSIGVEAFFKCDRLFKIKISETLLSKFQDSFPDEAYKTTMKAINLAKIQKHEALQKEIEAQRKADGLCPYCGGKFKGIFSLKCKKFGKPKDY